jgi:hypothetical protein
MENEAINNSPEGTPDSGYGINLNQPLARGFISLDLLNASDLETYKQFLKRKDIKIIKEVEKTVLGCYIDKDFAIPEQKIKFIIYNYLYKKPEHDPLFPDAFTLHKSRYALN